MLATLALSLALTSPPPEPASEPAGEPPAPSIEFREPPGASEVEPPPEDEPELVPFVMPGPATPPPDEDPPEWTIAENRLDDLPLAATAARKSAVRRHNDVLMRPFRKPTYAVAAVARLGALVADNRGLIRPIAWGLAMQLRLHFVRVGKARLGLELHAGHTRWQRRDEFTVVEGAAKLSRISLLTHTDVSAGPALELPLGPVFIQLGVSAGLAVSTLSRARSAEPADDLHITQPNPLVRGGAAIGLPIANNQGLVIGLAAQQPFSKREVLVDPQGPQDGAKTVAFDTWIESFLGYQVWF